MGFQMIRTVIIFLCCVERAGETSSFSTPNTFWSTQYARSIRSARWCCQSSLTHSRNLTTLMTQSLPLLIVNQSCVNFTTPSIIPNARSFTQATQKLRRFLRSFSPSRVHPPNNTFSHSPNSHFSPFTNSPFTNSPTNQSSPPQIERDSPNSPQSLAHNTHYPVRD